MKPIEPLETKDFNSEEFKEMRMTIYPDKRDDKDVIMLCVIDFKTLLYSINVGQFVDIVPDIVKHLYVHPKMSEDGYSITTIVPKGSFRIAKMPMVNGHTIRVCIIPHFTGNRQKEVY